MDKSSSSPMLTVTVWGLSHFSSLNISWVLSKLKCGGFLYLLPILPLKEKTAIDTYTEEEPDGRVASFTVYGVLPPSSTCTGDGSNTNPAVWAATESAHPPSSKNMKQSNNATPQARSPRTNNTLQPRKRTEIWKNLFMRFIRHDLR